MTEFVLDASAALSLIFEDEDPGGVRDAFQGGARAVVPSIFLFEVANAAVSAVRRGRIDPTDLASVLGGLGRLPISVVAEHPSPVGLAAIAVEHNLSAYDAAYLHLARERQVPLVTYDGQLAAAAASVLR
ncbi:putative nucleic acid-binding protein [Mumia flava]|uniref:Ribonuclease VapC n=1 Tax=Mumia flava TaxID=1348852 RepID=A0A2M9AQ88_9ACTN|nr:type II toxin-antitoxin system VapC family toxin [Mumia flava]PJJ47859.1 putative nucleic acid-binding protein [Mumia flava]